MSIYLQKNDDICEEANVFMSVSMRLWVFFLHIDDHSRIILKRNVNSSDYINANYINVSIKKKSNMHASTSFWQRTLFCKIYIQFFFYILQGADGEIQYIASQGIIFFRLCML